MIVGTVKEIRRYPVKSMAGELLEAAALDASGVRGDRGWAFRDETLGEITGAKKLPALLLCEARYVTEPGAQGVPAVCITLPDGSEIASDADAVNERFSALLGRELSLWPLRPASDRAHYRRALPGGALLAWLGRSRAFRRFLTRAAPYIGLDKELREGFSREPGEPLPDLSEIPAELIAFASPPGTYFDAFPLHLLTTASLAHMAGLNPKATWDARRFRPNFLIETDPSLCGPVETRWSGRTLRVGDARLRCEIPTVRCGMTTHAQEGLVKDPSVLRTIVREGGQNLGAYASVAEPGRVRVGDAVELLDA